MELNWGRKQGVILAILSLPKYLHLIHIYILLVLPATIYVITSVISMNSLFLKSTSPKLLSSHSHISEMHRSL